MTGRGPKEEIERLRREIRRHERLYYADDSPEISDAEFDALMSRLKALEEAHPALVTPDSPTQRVGGMPSAAFAPVAHITPMLSLDNCYSEKEFLEWDKRVAGGLRGEPYELAVEPKIDGLSCSIEYERGVFARASTRGDGETGEDVSLNVRTIRAVPLRLNLENPPAFFEARGEVYMDKKDFEALREEQMKEGLEPFANPRNAAAGSLRQKAPGITAARRLKFFAHSCGRLEGAESPGTHRAYLEYCARAGFPVPKTRRLCKSASEVLEFYKDCASKRSGLPYEIDGLAVKVNDLRQQKLLGSTSKSPRWAVAFKYPAQQATTTVKAVNFSVGRTGVITPVAELEPVKCGGVTISSATLHNFDEIERLGLKTGDRVVIERAGEVIPKVVKAVQGARTGGERPVRPPGKCPSCGAGLFRDEEEVALRCVNPSCPAQFRRALLHFASRGAMNIEGLGVSAAEQLVAKKLVRSFADVYRLKKEALLGLDLFQDRKAGNLLREIELSKQRPLSRFIFALGIRHIGEKTARVLAGRFGTMNAFMSAGEAALSRVGDVGPVIARAVAEFFKSRQTRALLAELEKLGLNMTEPERNKAGAGLEGRTFVFTGELKAMTRDEARTRVRELGGKEVSGVSSKTSYVVAGSAPGSKYDKAGKLGVKILTEEEFVKLLNEAQKM